MDIPLVKKRDVLRVIDASMSMGIFVRLAACIVVGFHRHFGGLSEDSSDGASVGVFVEDVMVVKGMIKKVETSELWTKRATTISRPGAN